MFFFSFVFLYLITKQKCCLLPEGVYQNNIFIFVHHLLTIKVLQPVLFPFSPTSFISSIKRTLCRIVLQASRCPFIFSYFQRFSRFFCLFCFVFTNRHVKICPVLV